MKIYQWGILSTANIGRKAMIPALKASPKANVTAVASRDAEKARQFASELSIPIAYGDYKSLLEDPAIDIIYNPLPNHLHKPLTIMAAEAGKHILCEKPLALNVDDCREMIAAATANGVQLMESFMYRHHPRIQTALDMIQKGAIGEVKTIISAFTFYLNREWDIRLQPEMGGGAVMDVGCYCINLSRLIAGREPEDVQAKSVMGKSGVEIQAAAILNFGDGLLAHFDCGFNQSRRHRCTISGTEGLIELQNVFVPGLTETTLLHVTGDQTHTKHFPAVDQYQLIAEHFMSVIEGNPRLYPLEDATANMRVIEALLKSAKNSGKPEKIR